MRLIRPMQQDERASLQPHLGFDQETDLVHVHPRPSKMLPLCSSVPHARSDLFGNQAALKLGHGAQDREYQSCLWVCWYPPAR
jgi:hypothetical protein